MLRHECNLPELKLHRGIASGKLQTCPTLLVSFPVVVPLVKAVQELSAENERLRNEMNELKGMVSKMVNEKSIDTENSMSNLSGAYLEQNQPNPFQGSTVIRYNLPEGITAATIDITGVNGQLLKSIPLTARGKGHVSLTANSLAKGVYTCTLWVNNQKAGSKQMLVK